MLARGCGLSLQRFGICGNVNVAVLTSHWLLVAVCFSSPSFRFTGYVLLKCSYKVRTFHYLFRPVFSTSTTISVRRIWTHDKEIRMLTLCHSHCWTNQQRITQINDAECVQWYREYFRAFRTVTGYYLWHGLITVALTFLRRSAHWTFLSEHPSVAFVRLGSP